jgi:capsular polysaccharide biosynthesis protein
MDNEVIDSRSLMTTARTWWFVVLAAAALGGLAGWAVVARSADVYESTARVVVGPLSADLDTLRASETLVKTYSDALMSDTQLAASQQDANIGGDLDTVRSSINLVPNTTTRIITIKARRPDPQSAALLARSLLAALQELPKASTPIIVDGGEPTAGPDSPAQRAADLAAPGMITVLDAPVVPTDPVQKSTTFAALVGAVVAAMVAFAGVVAIDARSQRRQGIEPTALIQRRLLGRCRLYPRGRLRNRRPIVERDPESANAVDYRLMATKAELLSPAATVRIISVCGTRDSLASGEVAANLSLSFALPGRNVALVDLVPSGMAGSLRLESRPRHVERVDGIVLEFAVIAVGHGATHVLRSQDPALNGRGASSPTALALVSRLFDVVVVHVPPLLLEPGAILVARQTTGVIVVDEDSDPNAADLIQALDVLEESDCPTLGGVLARPARGSARRRIPLTPLQSTGGGRFGAAPPHRVP